RLEVQAGLVDLEVRGVRSGHREVVGSQPVVVDVNVGDLHRGGGVGVRRDRVDLADQLDRGRRLVRGGGRLVDPQLRGVEVAAAVLVNGVQGAVAVHGDALVRLVRHRQRAARVLDGQRALDIPAAVDVLDFARLLADDQQVAGVRAGQVGQVGQREHVGEVVQA